MSNFLTTTTTVNDTQMSIGETTTTTTTASSSSSAAGSADPKGGLLPNDHKECIYQERFKQQQQQQCRRCDHSYIVHSFAHQFHQIKSYKSMKLSCEATCIQYTPNAGGSSVESEALSFEILKKSYNAHLLKTETQVAYFPFGGSKTDYVVYLFDAVIGVSVTRAFKYNCDLFTFEDAYILLEKKLKGILQSSRNALIEWDKQILHVWILNEQAAESLVQAWQQMDTNLKSNTVLLITLASSSKEIFINTTKKTRQKRLTTTQIVNRTS